jgi:hypothetical protein
MECWSDGLGLRNSDTIVSPSYFAYFAFSAANGILVLHFSVSGAIHRAPTL